MTQGTIFNLVVIFSGNELKEDDYMCVCVCVCVCDHQIIVLYT